VDPKISAAAAAFGAPIEFCRRRRRRCGGGGEAPTSILN